MKRLIEQESCEHGEWESHLAPDENSYLATSSCPGGSSREVTVDYEAAAQVLRVRLSTNGFKMKPAQVRAGHWISDIIHAALGDLS